MRIAVIHDGVEIGVDLFQGDTPRTVLGRLFADKGEADVPAGARLQDRNENILDPNRPMPECDEGTFFFLTVSF